MEDRKHDTKTRGGRPPKAVKRDQLLGIKCTLIERTVIEANAKKSLLKVSEYLREMGLNGKIDMSKRALPKEVLQFTATLNHLAANINQVAKKRNSNDELNGLERAELQYLSGQVKQLANDIKSYLK